MAERITGHTELIGLMAYPIRHSSSPAMHNEAFATLGLVYAEQNSCRTVLRRVISSS